jgi:hypothetical protein
MHVRKTCCISATLAAVRRISLPLDVVLPASFWKRLNINVSYEYLSPFEVAR